MSRDFILVLSGGLVSLLTTFIVLFIMDWVYRRDMHRQGFLPPPEHISTDSINKDSPI